MGPRRSHKKSRNGCRECKRRRIKCDEVSPCNNCTRHGISCSYVENGKAPRAAQLQATSQPLPAPASLSAPSVISSQTPDSSTSFNPRLTPEYDEGRDDSQLFDLLSAPVNVTSSPKDDDWLCDIDLMHHFCTVTASTLAVREDARHTWRVVVPREGFSNPYLTHGILAISALHKAYVYPTQREHHLSRSAHHQAEGLSTFRTIICNVENDTWPSVFCFASLVVFYTSALSVRIGGEKLPSPIRNISELFFVIKGIDAILAPYIPSLRKSLLAPLAYSVWLDGPMTRNRFIIFLFSIRPTPDSMLPADTSQHMTLLDEFIEAYELTSDERNEYNQSLSRLRSAMRQISLAGPDIEAGMVFIWPFGLTRSLISDIQQYRPIAIIILGYYCVLLALVDHFWFLKGWSKQVLADIESHLPANYSSFLEWPKRCVFG